MTLVDSGIEMFEEKAKRILWPPSLTLGYVFALSGAWLDFGLAVAAIGGARLFGDIVDSTQVEEADHGEQLLGSTFTVLEEQFPVRKMTLLAIFTIAYVVAVGYGIWRLFLHFEHTDPILVALAGIYSGIVIIVTLNV